MVKSKKWVLVKTFEGLPKKSDFKLEEEELSPDSLKDGEILCEAVFLTVDPYMRASQETRINPGDVMVGQQVAKVLASKNPKFKEGQLVLAYAGWRTHAIVSESGTMPLMPLPDMGPLSPSLALGVLGMPGMTAYFGFLEICYPQPGETVLINGAAGAVGSLVGQIAKIKGCKVIGYCGTDDKVKWLKELGFDAAYNYKKVDLNQSLTEAAPDGIDCYFDNVGGDFSVTSIKHMNLFGRMSICGSISGYNATSPPQGELPFFNILGKQLKVEGFIVLRWLPRWSEGQAEMSKWIKEGKIKYRETVTEGIENMPDAFIGLFEGSNTGKAIIK
ncbi:hypothetical protein KUTeg_021302, partial [Tegillarca granosa]